MSDKNKIMAFFHCKECLKDLPVSMSPQDFMKIDCGWTEEGFQVYCLRHELQVIHVDFQGVKQELVAPETEEETEIITTH